MSLTLIVAINKRGFIGKFGKMMWVDHEDLERFRELTQGGVVIMGRKTYESIGRPLPFRTNVVVTRKKKFNAVGCIVVRSLTKAMKKYPDAYIIGGAEIYEQALPFCKFIYMTKIDDVHRGDVKFPLRSFSNLFKWNVATDKYNK